MKKMILLAALSSLFVGGFARAGKVEDVQAALKKSCSKDVGNEDALRLVKTLFLSCTPGQKVDADGCSVDCLKENAGAVVGK